MKGQYPLDRGLSGPQCLSRHFGAEKISYLCRQSDPSFAVFKAIAQILYQLCYPASLGVDISRAADSRLGSG